MSRLEIRLLGTPEIAVNGERVTGLPAKLEALLFYLAAAPRSVSRSALAGLLWGERAEQDARMNLRAALAKLPASLTPHLTVTRDWLAFDRNTDISVDVQPFDQAVLSLVAAETPEARIARLREVAALHRDEFLAGFAPGNAPEFEAWCAAERTRLREGAVRVLMELLRLQKEGGDILDAIETARRVMRVSPGHDLALRELMMALVRSGQRNGAIEAYERARKAWREELGIAPSAETEQLAERIALGEGITTGAPPPPAANAVQVLLGRDREQAMVAQLLGTDQARIVSLTGLGGIGKSRLAQAVMAQVKEAFPDGTKVLSVGAMRSGAAVAPALAVALGLQLRGDLVVKQLLDYLREKRMLLVLDSFEAVVGTEAVDLLVQLAHAAPGLRILVTSREALGVSEEAAIALEGLAHPDAEAAKQPGWRDFAAVQLFIQRASRGYVQFDAEREREGIVRVCQRVQGIPLAIELAASLARNLPCIEIARAVERDLQTLQRDDAGLSPRHRSMARVLECAFSQLAPDLQACLARLSIFRGPFHSDAAEAIAQASLRQLSTLIDKSWLRRDPGAGYVLHDVIRQYAGTQRAGLGIDAVRLDQAHALHFAAWLGARQDSLRSGDNSQLLDDVRDVLPDLLAACEWGAQRGQDADFEPAFQSLFRYYEHRGDFISVEQFFKPALAALGQNRRARKRGLIASAATNLGWAYTHMSRYDDAVAQLEGAIAHARAAGAERQRAEAMRGVALAHCMQGRPAAAMPLLEECMAIVRGDPMGEMATLNVLGIAATYGGVGRGQADYYNQLLEIARTHRYIRGEVVANFNVGDDALSRGEFDLAERHFRRSYELSAVGGNRRNQCMCLANLASIAQQRGDLEGTRRSLDEAHELARVLGERRLYSFIYQGYAELAGAGGDWAGAQSWSRRMIGVADEIAWSWSAAFGVALLAQALTVTGQRDAALAAVRDLHRRVKDVEFEVHHANAAIEAARWLVANAPEGKVQPAVDVLSAIAAAEPVDVWARVRAKEALATREALATVAGLSPAAIGGACRDWMEIAVAALPPGDAPAR